MTPFKSSSRLAPSARTWAATLSLSGALLLAGCGGGYETEEKVMLTKGLITEVEEVSQDEYKITNETVVDDTAASKVIARHLSGQIDTFSMQEIRESQQAQTNGSGASGSWDQETNTSGNTTHHYHHYPSHGLSNILMGGMMGYYFGRSFSTPPNPGVYRDQGTYNRIASSTGQTLSRTAVRTTVRRPSGGSSGFGSGRSTRSFGG